MQVTILLDIVKIIFVIIIYFLNHTIVMANNLTFGIFYAIMELKSIFT